MARTTLRSAQITDSTLVDADIYSAAAIGNGKLDLASIAQAVTFTHSSGTRVESSTPAFVLRDTDNPVASGLWRTRLDGAELKFEQNTAVGGDFSTLALPLMIGAATDGSKVIVRQDSAALRIQRSAAASLELRDLDGPVIGTNVTAGLYRIVQTDPNVIIQRNTAAAGDFSTVKHLLAIGPQGIQVQGRVRLENVDGESGSNSKAFVQFFGTALLSETSSPSLFRDTDNATRISWNDSGTARVLAHTVDSVNHRISSAAPAFELRETDQALPAGLWRTMADGDTLRVDKNTAVAGDFSTYDQRLLFDASQTTLFSPDTNTEVNVQNGSIELNFPNTNFVVDEIDGVLLTASAPQIRLQDGDETPPDGLWRILGESTQVSIQQNTAVAMDFSTLSQLLTVTNEGVEVRGSFSLINGDVHDAEIFFDGTSSAASIDNNSIFRDTSDNRLHIKDNASVDKKIAYTDGDTFTNAILTATSNNISAKALLSATTTVDVFAAAAPTSGQVLTATGASAATWQTPSAPVAPNVVALTDGANIATDASLGNEFRVTLAGNRTLDNPTNPTNGQKAIWRFKQDSTGGRTITLGSQFRFGTDITAVTLTSDANAIDYMTAIYNSTDTKWDVVGFVRGYGI